MDAVSNKPRLDMLHFIDNSSFISSFICW